MTAQQVIRDMPPFLDQKVETAALLAAEDVYGSPEKWGKSIRIYVRKFFHAVYDLPAEGVSLASLKDIIDRYDTAGNGRLNRIFFRFLVRLERHYAAPDAEAFHDAVRILKKREMSYVVAFDPDVKTFDDIAYNSYYGRTDFYVVRASDKALKVLLRRFIIQNVFTSGLKPSQVRFDRLASIMAESLCGGRYAVGCPIGVGTLFRAVDTTADLRDAGEINDREYLETVGDIVRFFRHCHNKEHVVISEAPFTDLSILRKGATMRFFTREYLSRETTFVFRRRGQHGATVPVTVDIGNPAVRTAVGQVLLSGTVSYEEYLLVRDTFADSLGDIADSIRSYADWSEKALFQQVSYYRRLYEGQKRRTYALSFLKAFYLNVGVQTNGAFFRRAQTLTYGLLTSKRFVLYCDQGYVFRPYSEFDSVDEGRRIVFIVKGFNERMRKFLKEDYISVDLTEISDDFYRGLAWQAITSTAHRLYRAQFAGTLRILLRYLTAVKRKDGWPTPDRTRFSFHDALATITLFHGRSSNPSAYNNWIQNVRDFLRWAEDTRRLGVDEAAFEIITQINEPTMKKRTPQVIPPEHMDALLSHFARKSQDSTDHAQALILLNIIGTTPLRIGHACSLVRDEVIRDPVNGSYSVYSTSKTTGGDPVKIIIGRYAGLFIGKALDIAGVIGLDCPQDDLRENIFIYRNKSTFYVWTPARFGKFLEEACGTCGLPHYTSRDVRATFMTRAYVDACKNGEVNDYLLKLYSYHRRSGTTLEHYVDRCEALSALRDALGKGRQWNDTLYPDERSALKAAIAEYDALIAEESSPERRAILEKLRDECVKRLENL